jgi:cytochrome c-type biogenesis protein CcmH
MTSLIRILFFCIVLCVNSASAIDSDWQQKATEMFNNTMSPYCPGRTISACPSDQARLLREDIEKQLQDGKTEEQIRIGLEKKYGDAILAMPKPQGVGILIWLVPIVSVVFGLILILVILKKSPAPKISEELSL